MQIKPYERVAQYYETDQMGIIHHSNYIRWFEEARVDMLIQCGLPYGVMESRGIAIPVLGVSCDYHKPVRFEDTVIIYMKTENFVSTHGIRFVVNYRIVNKQTGELLTVGQTRHCFSDMNLKLLRLKKEHPDVYGTFAALEEMGWTGQ